MGRTGFRRGRQRQGAHSAGCCRGNAARPEGGTSEKLAVPAVATPNLLTFCFRGWRKKKSEISTDAEDRAEAVIREEFQNLGPIKCVARGILGAGRELGTRLSGEVPPGLTPGSPGVDSQGNFRTCGLGMEGRELAYTVSLLPWCWGRYPEDQNAP